MSATKDPKEVQDMRTGLADARRRARGVKDSARNLRAAPSERLAQLTDEDMRAYDESHPPPSTTDDTTKRLDATKRV